MQQQLGRHTMARVCVLCFVAFLPAAAKAQVQEHALQDAAQQIPQADPQDLYNRAMQAEWAGNYTQARALHTQAAALGHARAHYQMGFLLLDGLGGERDVIGARAHLRQAADGGVTLALVPYLYAYDDQDDSSAPPDAFIAAHALLELAIRDLGMAGDTIQFWSQPMRRQVQVYLQEAGYYRGAIDGLIGQGSLNALRAFARARTPLPELPNQRFERIVITAQGVRSDERQLFAFRDIEDLADARAAILGAQIEETAEGHWRISVAGEALLDWPRPTANTEDHVMVFQLPGKPQRTNFSFGMPFSAVARDDLGACALRVLPVEAGGTYVRRCETRVTGVRLLFEASNGPADDLDSANAGGDRPIGEVLRAVELTAPLTLRLADN